MLFGCEMVRWGTVVFMCRWMMVIVYVTSVRCSSPVPDCSKSCCGVEQRFLPDSGHTLQSWMLPAPEIHTLTYWHTDPHIHCCSPVLDCSDTGHTRSLTMLLHWHVLACLLLTERTALSTVDNLLHVTTAALSVYKFQLHKCTLVTHRLCLLFLLLALSLFVITKAKLVSISLCYKSHHFKAAYIKILSNNLTDRSDSSELWRQWVACA